jgi:hypothetical protein
MPYVNVAFNKTPIAVFTTCRWAMDIGNGSICGSSGIVSV